MYNVSSSMHHAECMYLCMCVHAYLLTFAYILYSTTVYIVEILQHRNFISFVLLWLREALISRYRVEFLFPLLYIQKKTQFFPFLQSFCYFYRLSFTLLFVSYVIVCMTQLQFLSRKIIDMTRRMNSTRWENNIRKSNRNLNKRYIHTNDDIHVKSNFGCDGDSGCGGGGGMYECIYTTRRDYACMHACIRDNVCRAI